MRPLPEIRYPFVNLAGNPGAMTRVLDGSWRKLFEWKRPLGRSQSTPGVGQNVQQQDQSKLGQEAQFPNTIPSKLRGNETVLVVDEAPMMREAVADILRQFGYRVLEASGSSDAQHCAHAQRKIHLLVLDLAAPETSGLELARWFRAMYPETRVLLTTTWLWGLDPVREDLSGIAALAKPFTPLELARMVRLILD